MAMMVRERLWSSFSVVLAAAVSFAWSQTAVAQIDAQVEVPVSAAEAGVTADARCPTEDTTPAATLPLEEANPAEAEVDNMLSAIKGQDVSALDLEALLENVVVTATKSEIKEDEAPAITTVISREEIQRWGYQSVAEVLKHVAGVTIVDDHSIPNIGVRGISGGLRSESGLVKVMIDGHSVAFRSTSGNWLGSELIPLSVVQQVEVIRGPASALYGADAFLGVINIVTRKAEQMQGGEIVLSGNHEGDYGMSHDMALGATVGDWQILASLRTSAENHSGLTLPASSPAPRLGSDASTSLQAHDLTLGSTVAFVRTGYQLGKRGSVGIIGYLSQLDRGAEFADWAQLTHNLDSSGRQNGTKISLRQGMVGLDLELHLSPTVDLRVNGLFFDGGPTSRDRIEVGSDLYYVKRDFGYRGFDAGTEVVWHPSDAFNVLLGAGMILDHEKLPDVYDVLKSSVGTQPGQQAGDEISTTGDAGNKNLSNVGANALIIWTPMSRVSLTGGLRFDHHSVYGDKVSGRFGSVATLLPNLHLKLLYGSAFKAPSPQLLYGSPLAPGDIAGNRALKPSYVHTVESQLSYRPNRYLLVTSGVAYSYLLDQAAFAQRGINQVALNISRVGSISWENELRFDYKRKLAAYGNLTINHTVSSFSENSYVAALSTYNNAAYPVVVANTGVSAEIPLLPLRANVELSYASSRPSSAANTLEAGGRYDLAPYVLLGANLRTVGLHLLAQKETTLQLVMRNLTDKRYSDPGFAGIDYPQLGRTFLMQASQEF
jgi:outer membrane receptor for ferrienterochelin and colicins